MIETVVVTERIATGIVWGVYIDKFYSSTKSLQKRMENNKVIAFNDKVIIRF